MNPPNGQSSGGETPGEGARFSLARSDREKVGLPATTSAPSFDYPRHRCVHELIEEQAGRNPEASAVIFGEQRLTYRELNEKANQLARFLRDRHHVGPGSLVGILVNRSIEMMIGLLGVLKAGGAYVPLDPHYPEERIAYILGDAQMEVLVTQSFCPLKSPGVRQVNLDSEWPEISRQPAETLAASAGPEDLAYVIYTSGPTGAPKGVQIRHRSLTHFLWSMAQRPGCTAEDHVLALTTICFDIAALELFLPLIQVGRVEILPDEIVKNGVRLKQKVERSPATIIQATPATWKMLLAAELGRLPRVKALCGGEAWDAELARELLPRTRELWNMYGPTETTIWSSIQKVEPGEPVRLGDPIGNTRFYVFDEQMRPVRSGEIGELYIGGDGLANGYLNRPDLTNERFVPDPIQKDSLIYRTGDLVRYV